MFSGFAVNNDDTESEPEEEEEEEEQKEEIIEEKKDVEVAKPQKKKRKRNRGKKAKPQQQQNDDKDSDKSDKEDNDEDKDSDKSNQENDLKDMGIFDENCLALIVKNFNYNKELNSHFKGTKLVENTDYGNLNKRQKAYLKQQQRKNKPNKNFNLVHNDDVFTKLPDKLDCEFIKVNEYGHRVFAFKPNQKFMNLSETYEQVRNTHDPNNMSQFAQMNPHYPEAIYDLGELLRLQGDMKGANRLLEQSLFLYEESFSYEFSIFSNTLCNLVILDYEYNIFSKLLFKTVFRMIAI